MLDRLFDSTSQILAKGLELRTLRQSFLASNVANAETPNYRPVDLDFRATMANLVSEMHGTEAARSAEVPLELARTDSRHLAAALNGAAPSQGGIVFAAGDDYGTGNDSNSTSLEEQMGRLEMNSIQHAALTRILTRRVSDLRSIVDSSSKV